MKTKKFENKLDRSMIVFLVFCLVINVEGNNVTYPGIGTFTDEDFKDPIYRPIVLLPNSPEEIDPTFSLYTNLNIEIPDNLTYNDLEKMRKSNFDSGHQTKIILHGFIDNTSIGKWMEEMKNNWLEAMNCNVVIVDWRDGNFFPYLKAVANTRVLGPMVGIFIENLCQVFGVSVESFHIIGHSLGSHIAGYTGKFLNGKLGHITALDPAGLLFEGLNNTEAGLWHTDARFVEAIHTDAAKTMTIGLGMWETCAHFDVYLNGGSVQPGCNRERVTSILVEGILEGGRKLFACDHQRAIDYYTEIIVESQYFPLSFVCESYDSYLKGDCTECGSDQTLCLTLSPTVEIKDLTLIQGRRFFLNTDERTPFFKPQYLVQLNLIKNDTTEEVIGKIRLSLIENDDIKYDIDFNKDSETFYHNQTYRRVCTMNIDLFKVRKLEFQWSYGMIGDLISTYSLHVESVQFTKLPTDSANAIQHKFEPLNESNRIENSLIEVFVPVEKGDQVKRMRELPIVKSEL